MFKNKALCGKNNICGENVCKLRKAQTPKMSQRMLAEKLQLFGIDVDKNAIQRIESGQRFVTDIELIVIAKIFDVSCDELLNNSKKQAQFWACFLYNENHVGGYLLVINFYSIVSVPSVKVRRVIPVAFATFTKVIFSSTTALSPSPTVTVS